MNRNQFTLLLFLLVVLGLAGLMVYNRQNDIAKTGDPAIGQKLLGDLPVNDVAHIALKQSTNELNLVKKDNLWRVRERNNYPANYSEISDFLLKAKDLKIVQSEKVGPSQLSRLNLVTGQGTNAALVVDLKDQNDKSIQSLLLGKKHLQKSKGPSPFGDMGDQGWPDGRYVKVGTASDTVALISDALANMEPRPEQWLNKDFFKVEKVRSIAVEGPAVTNSWKITRDSETAEWKLADAKPTEQLDTSKTSSAGTALGSPSFTDVVTGNSPDAVGLDKPTLVNLVTFDDFTYTLKVGHKTNDTYALTIVVSGKVPTERIAGKDEKPEDKAKLDKEFKEKQKKLEDKLAQEKGYENWIYLVSNWTLDPLLKDRAQLLVEKKEEPKKEEKPTASTLELPKSLDDAAKPDAQPAPQK
jgi:hypothetical protein